MKWFAMILVAGAALSVSCTTFATTWHVHPNPDSGHATTIQEGIYLASPADTVLVACGTYYDCTHQDLYGDYNCVIMQSGVCLRSETGEADCVTIDAQGSGRGIYCYGVDGSAKIEGFTITHGYLPLRGGGGMLCYDSSPRLTNCTFSENVVDSVGSGGGMKCYNSSPTLTGCMFSGNCAMNGGGIHSMLSSVRLSSCTFSSDSAANWGGGICFDTDSADSIVDCIFLDNIARQGGGVYFQMSSPPLARCVFSGNTGRNCGGGIMCGGSSPRLTHCIFSQNSAQWGGLRSSLWDGSGGAVMSFGLTPQTMSFPTLSGCTLYRNSVVDKGAGIYSFSLSIVTVENTIIASGTSGAAVWCEQGATITLSCSDVYDNAGGDWIGCILGQEGINGNFSAPPLFCEPESGDFSISEYSPCAPSHSPPGCGLIGADSVACSITRVDVAEAEMPTTLYIGPAVPNPFNPVTEIGYGIPRGPLPPASSCTSMMPRGVR